MKTKLIIVEGIPGSGKTTTAKTIRDWLDDKGLKSLLYLEDSSYHPVDLDNLSYFNEEQYKHLVEENREYQHAIEKISEKCGDGYIVHYRRLNEVGNEKIPADFSKILFAHDAHDTLHPKKYHALMLERWQRFCTKAMVREELIIFECCLLQNPLTTFIGKHNYEANKVKLLIYKLAEMVQELNPILIYLRGESAPETLKRAIGERPQAWINSVEEYITSQGYGKANSLSGRDGIFHFYEMLQEIEDEIISELEWRRLIVDNTAWNWERHNKDVENFLIENV